MEKSVGEDTMVIMEVKDDCLQQCERRNPRKRLIQSTLFPHKPQFNETDALDEEHGEDKEDGCDCGSPSGARKKKSKGTAKAKAKTNTTTPKKV